MYGYFRNEPLDDVAGVGRIESDAAQLWIRVSKPGPYLVRWWPVGDDRHAHDQIIEVPADNLRDNTRSFRISGEGGALQPMRQYCFRVTSRDGARLVGEGRFETAPFGVRDAPPWYAFAIMSCNQPFGPDGYLREDARQMLTATLRCLEEHDVKFIFMMGDQMYADYPKNLSFFNAEYFATIAPPGRSCIQDCSTAEVRRLYQQRYRQFWNVSALKEMFARYPCYLILDDHDIVDNWGSDPDHETPKWQSLGEGARWAYFDYQGSRVLPLTDNLPDSFHFDVAYGHTATFAMDLRSERRATGKGELYSESQERDLRLFLARNRDKKVLMFVLSVPPVHLPRFLAQMAARLTPSGEDFSDRWAAPSHIRDRDRFLKIIHEHQLENPTQRIVLLGGDIHVGCVHEISWVEGDVHMHQFISSGVTNRASLPLQLGAMALIRFKRTVATEDGEVTAKVRLVPGTRRRHQNPYAKVNLGIVQVDASAEASPARLRFLLYGHEGEKPVCAYASSWV